LSEELGKVREDLGFFQRSDLHFDVPYEAWVIKKKPENGIFWALNEIVGVSQLKVIRVFHSIVNF
jgi:hypothetical protein